MLKKEKINILILNKELRIIDNQAFLECVNQNEPFLIIYYDHCKPRKPSEISFFWLLKSIKSFENDLMDFFGINFKIIYSLSEKSLEYIFSIIQNKFEITQVFFNFSELFLPKVFFKNKIKLNSFSGNFIINYKKLNREFKVFTPFYNHCIEEFIKNENSEIFTFFESLDIQGLSNDQIQKDFFIKNQDFWSNFEKIKPKEYKDNSSIFGIYNFENFHKDFPEWWIELEKNWEIGERFALKKFERFCEFDVEFYGEKRDFLYSNNNLFEIHNNHQSLLSGWTSKLSPNIHFGEISVRFIFKKLFEKSLSNKNIQTFLKQIFWREFAYNISNFHPNDLHSKELRIGFFDDFAWNNPEKQNKFERWKKGQTGFPVIDAAMRQLWQTGWMHNRARMIVASFLVKNLLIDWRLGEQWFFETLVDGDEAVNPFSWQWVSGCGTDSAPYFRIFNPVLQSQKFDADGFYIKKFVKELDFVENNKIHEPWKFFKNLSNFYFEPIIDLQESRNKALENFHKIKNKKY